MPDKKDQTEAGATELRDEDLSEVQGGLVGGSNTDNLLRKKAGIITLPDAQERGGAGFFDEADA